MTLLEGLLESYIRVDASADVIYGSDQAFVSYPCRFATVNIELLSSDGLVAVANLIREQHNLCAWYELDGYYNFYIGLNDYSETKIDSVIEFVVTCSTYPDDEQKYLIDLTERDQMALWDALNRQCKEVYGKGCEELLAEARAAMEED